MNQDGSGLVRLNSDVVLWGVTAAGGNHVAYATDLEVEGDPDGLRGAVLRILELPAGITRTVTGLQVPAGADLLEEDLIRANFDVFRALGEGGLAWSPNGRTLAFASGHEGMSADLYLYALDSGEITRLTDGPADACQFGWSPDGRYIYHVGMAAFGTGAGSIVDSVWVARADGSGNRLLYRSEPDSVGESLLAWISADTALVCSSHIDRGGRNLRLIDMRSGETQSVWPDRFRAAARNPADGTILLDAADIRGNPDAADGYFAIEPEGLRPRRISAAEYEALVVDAEPLWDESYLYRSSSPDGQAVFTLDYRSGLVRVARAPAFVPEILSRAVEPLPMGPVVVWAVP
jgi:WD40 repeat protein